MKIRFKLCMLFTVPDYLAMFLGRRQHHSWCRHTQNPTKTFDVNLKKKNQHLLNFHDYQDLT